MTSALFSALFSCLSYRNTKSGNKMHMTILISPTFSQKLTFTVMSNNSACIVWNCNPIWPVWDGFKMFYSSNKYKNFVSWCQFRSHCFIGAPDVTWFTSHWLPSLILPTAVASLSCQMPHHHHPNYYSIHLIFCIHSPALVDFSLPTSHSLLTYFSLWK